jgi:hypothetical protein
MSQVKKIVVASAILLFSQIAFASPNCSNLVGDWANQLKSTLSITNINATTGLITATYTSPSGTGGQPFAAIGWVNAAPPASSMDNAPVISFSVQWGSYGSITSWTGYCSVISGVPTITTVWHLARANSQFNWDHILTNSDLFIPK